jgi:hypothetical protein
MKEIKGLEISLASIDKKIEHKKEQQ